MSFKETLGIILADFRRIENVKRASGYNKNKIRIKRVLLFLKSLLWEESFMVTFWFRIGSYLQQKHNIIAKFFLSIVAIIHKINCRITGIQLPIGTKIGKGLLFNHYSGIVLAKSVTIGDNCTIFQNVTIGRTWNKTPPPVIGNGVMLCAGCKIIGDVEIGDNVIVGANAVVTKSIPDNCVAAGIPAKIVSNDSSKCITGFWSVWFGKDNHK